MDVDARVAAQGTPVAAAEPFVIVHCATNRRLAGVQLSLPTEFGMEFAVCCHTFTGLGKVNKLMRESKGRPTSDQISQSEQTETFSPWCDQASGRVFRAPLTRESVA